MKLLADTSIFCYGYNICPRDKWCGESLLQYIEKIIFLYFMIRYSFPWIINTLGSSPLRSALFLYSFSLFCCALYVHSWICTKYIIMVSCRYLEYSCSPGSTRCWGGRRIHGHASAVIGSAGSSWRQTHQEACNKVTVAGAYHSSDHYHKNLSLRPWSKLDHVWFCCCRTMMASFIGSGPWIPIFFLFPGDAWLCIDQILENVWTSP